MAMLRQLRRRDRTRGQSLVEFALVLPILLILMLGILDFGRAISPTTPSRTELGAAHGSPSSTRTSATSPRRGGGGIGLAASWSDFDENVEGCPTSSDQRRLLSGDRVRHRGCGLHANTSPRHPSSASSSGASPSVRRARCLSSGSHHEVTFDAAPQPHATPKGQTLVIVGVGMVVLVGLVGLIIDVGLQWGDNRGAQNASDASAEAGAVVLMEYMLGATHDDDDVLDAVEDAAAAGGIEVDLAEYTDWQGMPSTPPSRWATAARSRPARRASGS